MAKTVTLIGFGEAGSTFAQAGGWGQQCCAYDVQPERGAAIAAAGVNMAASAPAAVAGSTLVLSLVTADQAFCAAAEAAASIAAGAIFCDMNSIAPETKRAAAAMIEQAGGRYVDVAILAPVHPAGLAVPLLLSGSAASAAEAALCQLGFTNTRLAGSEVGRASAIKMIRSVMIKGIEALTAEMMAAAEAAGVTGEVLASLDRSERQFGWQERAAYNLERMETHGLRRAAEMEEAAKTLAALGVDPVMTRGTIAKQRELAGPRAPREQAA